MQNRVFASWSIELAGKRGAYFTLRKGNKQKANTQQNKQNTDNSRYIYIQEE